jgi:hypothetical protein
LIQRQRAERVCDIPTLSNQPLTHSLGATFTTKVSFLSQYTRNHVTRIFQLQLTCSRASRFLPAHLNRQIITILSSLGIPDNVFVRYQKKMLEFAMTDKYQLIPIGLLTPRLTTTMRQFEFSTTISTATERVCLFCIPRTDLHSCHVGQSNSRW